MSPCLTFLLCSPSSYLVLYSGIVCHRWRAGVVSADMLQYPKAKFVCIGALEAAGAMLGLFAAGQIPCVTSPVDTSMLDKDTRSPCFCVWCPLLLKRSLVGGSAGLLLLFSVDFTTILLTAATVVII